MQPRKHRIVGMVEAEIASLQALLGRLKREIKEKQAAHLDAELKLKPLIALLEVYQSKRIESANTALAFVNTASLRSVPPQVVSRDDPDATDEDFEPVEATFNTIEKWAAVRSLKFKTWDDLRAINIHREKFELPPFKRKF